MNEGVCNPRNWRVWYVEACLATLGAYTTFTTSSFHLPALLRVTEPYLGHTEWLEVSIVRKWEVALPCTEPTHLLLVFWFHFLMSSKNSTMINHDTLSRIRKQTGGQAKPKESSTRQTSYWDYQKPIDIYNINTQGKSKLQQRAGRVITSSVFWRSPVSFPLPEKMGDLHPKYNCLCVCSI